MRQYGDEKDYSLGGHSLGGSIALDTLKQSKSIRDRTQVAHVFNPGYTLPFHNSIKPTDKKVKRQLDTKVNIHRVKKDIVSAHANKETAFGNLFEYNSDKDADLLEKHSLDTFTNSDL
jgi:surfactin synthase thioesterase subunit